MKNPLRYIWLLLGFISFAIGTVGIVLPILPTFPFYLATLFCFAKSSKKLHDWFINHPLYKKYLERFLQRRPMTWKAKAAVLVPLSAAMLVGFIMMKRVPVGRICLAVIWLFHVIYFIFGIKTEHEETSDEKPLCENPRQPDKKRLQNSEAAS